MLGVAAISALIFQTALMAAEAGSGGNWLTVGNRLRLEYDDNVYEDQTDKQDSFKVIEEVELGATFNFEPTFITLRYRPSFTYWADREPDDTDLHHDFDLVINHTVSPRLSMGLKNMFRDAEVSEEISRGTTIREEGDYIYNVTDANVDYRLLPRTYVLIGGRYTTLQYDDDAVAATEDYDIWSAGVTLRQNVTELTRLMADYRFESTDYLDGDDRGAESDYVGLGIESMLGSSFVGVLRGGMQNKDFNSESIEDADEPYFDATLTYILSPRTRFSAGGGFSMFEADVYPYASQDRTVFFASVAHDLTAKISAYLSASYQLSEYDPEQKIEDIEVPDAFSGDEEILQGSARVAYQLNARNSIELNYQYVDLTSDLREDYDRNRVSIGWRLDI